MNYILMETSKKLDRKSAERLLKCIFNLSEGLEDFCGYLDRGEFSFNGEKKEFLIGQVLPIACRYRDEDSDKYNSYSFVEDVIGELYGIRA